ANIYGTDLNLQYPAGWEEARRIKFAQGFTGPAPRDYVGTAPLSAPESLAIYDLTIRLDPALTLSYHTQGGIIYWKYQNFMPPRSLEFAECFAMSSGYALEETPYASGFAGYKDWFIETYNRPGYTIECGLGENPLPMSQFDEIYRENIGILVLAALSC
ncbi:MAG TPA: gamma-D-glutamyl-meso-diaminopimelate peptidase, partial [Clostridiales bacterium]|nr:gamma-D-glutamyl-meso-diaminopimelate peptidase [Clostridiales bacterium]